MSIEKDLLSMAEPKYKNFTVKLIPGINPASVLGIRVPKLKKYAAEIFGTQKADRFLSQLPHNYFEENNLHGFLICRIKDFERCVTEIEEFLPYVDNWATCDGLRPKVFSKNKDKLEEYCFKWMSSSRPFTVRFGIEMLMTYFADGDFRPEHLVKVAKIKSEHYYINMMSAWYFATMLAKQWDSTVVYFEKAGLLDEKVYKMALQKARDSFRITAEQKARLNSLKRRSQKGEF